MKLFFFTIGARDRASSRLRVWDHVEWFRAQGHEVEIDSVMPWSAKRLSLRFLIFTAAAMPRRLLRFFAADAILVQEALLLWPAALLKDLGKRRRLVFDFSDPVDRVGGKLRRRLRRGMMNLLVRRADAVFVENRSYLDPIAALGGRGHAFYGPVNATRYRQERASRGACRIDDGSLRIGWTGSPGTLRFISPIFPAIDALGRERSVELLLMGADRVQYSFEAAKLTLVDWTEEAEFALVPTFDLGLFRLEPGEDALWRGAGKLFIYMAAGVPFVASDVGIARTLMVEAGIGFPVTDDGDWLNVLRKAAAVPEERARMSESSLAFARDNLSYEVYRARLTEQLLPAGIEARS